MARKIYRRFATHIRSHPGQGMVEFALALPILLMMVFGIIEFGRLLQAWLALENGARFAVRYAVTGAYDPEFCDEAGAALGLTADDGADGNIDCMVGDWIDDSEEKTAALQDWARLPSIREAGLSGATGIALNDETTVSGDYLSYLDKAFDTSSLVQDHRGNPSLPGYFNTSICSNRVSAPDGGAPYGSIRMFNPNPFYYEPHPAGQDGAYRFPTYCQQAKLDSGGGVTGDIVRYVDDAGGPGDRVRVILSYRHTLITPFLSSWWPTLTLHAEREGLVEKFRTSRVTGLSGAIAFAATWTYTPPPPTETLTPTLTPTPAYCTGTGSVLREWYLGISGSNLSSLIDHPDYPDYPSGHNFPTQFDAPVNWDSDYGTRMRAYLCPPYTGQYRFWISSDDYSQLYLSPSQNESGGQLLAYVNGYTSHREFDKYSSQKSSLVTLAGGQLYYIEAIHKEGTGGDSLTVAWAGPGISDDTDTPTVIDGLYLVPLEPKVQPTRTPTATPEANCNQLVSLFTGETLRHQYYNHGGYLLESRIQNVGPHDIYLTGSSMNYNGAWHNEMQGPDPDREFDMYAWNGNTSAIYNVSPNITANSYGHTFPTAKKLNPNDSNYFKWTYNNSVFNFWITPYVRSYPMPAAGQPTPARDPFDGSTIYRNFYWSGDFSSTINYNIVPQVGPTVSCEMDFNGILGPVIQPTYTVNSSNDMTLRAVVRGSGPSSNIDSNVNEVRFFVYNSSGTLVHWYTDTSARYCLFGGNSSCTTKRINVDHWWYGSSSKPGPLITNDTYTFVVMAQNNDGDNRKKSALEVNQYNISGPTPTRTPIPPTKTNTRIPPTKTNTRIPSLTPIPSKTPLPSNTPLPSKTPLPSNTPLPSATPTKCQTPIELGGCQ